VAEIESIGRRLHSVDCWVSLPATPEVEIGHPLPVLSVWLFCIFSFQRRVRSWLGSVIIAMAAPGLIRVRRQVAH
jgi:hypothetical protein